MFSFQTKHIEDLAIGSGILGSGGGGDPTYATWMLHHQIEQYGPIVIRSLNSLTESDWVAPLALMGAPLIGREKVLSSRELEAVLDAIEEQSGRRITALMIGEIGGSNAFTPLLIAGKRGLPVIDADLIGRAFPKLEMNSASLHGLPTTPIWIADSLGNRVCIKGDDPKRLEELARHVAVAMGSSCAFSFAVGDGPLMQSHAIAGSLTRALKLGAAVRLADDPFRALREAEGHCLASGVISDIDSSIDAGFLKGRVTLTTQTGEVTLFYQNEYLLAEKEGQCLGCTPDLLVLLDESSGLALMSERLRFGLQVQLFALPAPTRWKSPAGQALVGPEAFGYLIKGRAACATS